MNEQNVILEEDGFEEEIDVLEETSVTMAMWGDITGNIENQTDLQNALDAKQDSLSQAQLDATNSGITSAKVAKYDGYEATINAKADQSALDAETIARGEADTALGTRIDNEVTARQTADNGLQSQIDAITSKSDVVDVVANYAALQNYDTSALGNNDVVKVLDDEAHEDALTYYRWNATTRTWSYIGQEAPYYSKGQMDVKLAEKQDKLTAGANIQIQNGTISATDTTYTAGNGLNLNGTEFSADTTVLTTKEDLEDYYTKPETDNLLAPKLEAEVVAELPTTGEEGKLYLTPKAHTTQTATGNPITATVAEEAGKIESFQLDGDTFQQTYTGKNLLELPDTFTDIGANMTVTTSNGLTTISSSGTTRTYPHWCEQDDSYPAGTYTFSISEALEYDIFIRLYQDASTYPETFTIRAGETESTRTITYDTVKILGLIALPLGSAYSKTFNAQIESGNTATSFEPYVGGMASPNPEYPQPIQTVTGEQTITVNGTDYPLDLGTIELCKLGTYQDYIWKDGEDWKVHNATKKVKLEDVAEWFGYAQGSLYVHYLVDTSSASGSLSNNPIVSSDFHADFLIEENSCFLGNNNHRVCFCPLATLNWADYISNKHPVVYYALATPTDTVITDQALIDQLEAIRTASLQNGANTITNTATGSNLAGDMEIGYYGYNPRNRYDKWLWLDIDNEYEQLGS